MQSRSLFIRDRPTRVIDAEGGESDRTFAQCVEEKTPALHTENYALVSPLDREIARLNFEGKLKTAVEEVGKAQTSIDFGKWQATVSFGFPQFDGGPKAPGTKDHRGRALVAQLSSDVFLVTGIDARVEFHVAPSASGHIQILRAEEGRHENDTWKFLRLWNGDQTDFGLNFTHQGTVVHVRLGTY